MVNERLFELPKYLNILIRLSLSRIYIEKNDLEKKNLILDILSLRSFLMKKASKSAMIALPRTPSHIKTQQSPALVHTNTKSKTKSKKHDDNETEFTLNEMNITAATYLDANHERNLGSEGVGSNGVGSGAGGEREGEMKDVLKDDVVLMPRRMFFSEVDNDSLELTRLIQEDNNNNNKNNNKVLLAPKLTSKQKSNQKQTETEEVEETEEVSQQQEQTEKDRQHQQEQELKEQMELEEQKELKELKELEELQKRELMLREEKVREEETEREERKRMMRRMQLSTDAAAQLLQTKREYEQPSSSSPDEEDDEDEENDENERSDATSQSDPSDSSGSSDPRDPRDESQSEQSQSEEEQESEEVKEDAKSSIPLFSQSPYNNNTIKSSSPTDTTETTSRSSASPAHEYMSGVVLNEPLDKAEGVYDPVLDTKENGIVSMFLGDDINNNEHYLSDNNHQQKVKCSFFSCLL